MAPNKVTDGEPLVEVATVSQTMHQMHMDDLFYGDVARDVVNELTDKTIRWVDLPPYPLPQPSRPPKGAEVLEVEKVISSDKRMKLVYFLGGCEMAGNQLDPFMNGEKNLLSIGPHAINRYAMEGPLGPGLFGPMTGEFVRVINKSVVGQSWHEVSVASVDRYVADWCEARPSVTVVSLGFWDMVMGHMAWTPECATQGVFGSYYTAQLNAFLLHAKRYCFTNRINFDAWYVDHSFIFISVPVWARLRPEMVSKYTISVKTFTTLRRVCFRDMYPLEATLWRDYRGFVFNPKVPVDQLHANNCFYTLGPKYSRLYIAQILSVVAKFVCVRPACRLPTEHLFLKDHMLDRPSKIRARKKFLSQVVQCGPYFAWFVPQGSSLREMHELGHC